MAKKSVAGLEPFPSLLGALRALRAANAEGFEGLIRDCLEVLCKRTLNLKKSGHQDGSDIASNEVSHLPNIRVEAKRFSAKTDLALDLLKAKLREAMTVHEGADVWALAFSREMHAQDWAALEELAAEVGVTVVCLDWRNGAGSLPALGIVCAQAPDLVLRVLPESVAADLNEIASHPAYAARCAELALALTDPGVGFELAAKSHEAWLRDSLRGRDTARRNLKNDAEILADGAAVVGRPQVEQVLQGWWGDATRPIGVLLGEEGRGKTWCALQWRLGQADTAVLCLFVSAKDVIVGDPEATVARLLARTAPKAASGSLLRRLKRWLGDGKRQLLLIVDGLNERWDFEWRAWLDRLKTELWSDRVRVLVTCRANYWSDELFRLEALSTGKPTEISVPEFSETERDQLLAKHGLMPKALKKNLLDLMRVPRFVGLAIELRDSLGDADVITPAMLVLEDWRARRARGDLKLDDEALVQLVAEMGSKVGAAAGFETTAKELGDRMAKASGREIAYYHTTIDELVSGLWLRRGAGPHRYELNEVLLPYAIGLDLCLKLEGITDRSGAQNVIAEYREQLRGADIATAILRAATTFMLIRKNAPAPVRTALIESWLDTQNFGARDFEEFWAVLPQDLVLILNIAEEHFKDGPVRLDEGETLIKAFANAARWDAVRVELVKRLPKWAGGYGLDFYKWYFDRDKEADPARESKARERVKSWIAIESSFGGDLSANLEVRPREHLASAAFAIISYLPRARFIDVFLTWALTRAIMGFDAGRERFDWVLRLNREDPKDAFAAFMDAVNRLRALGAPVADSTAAILEQALSQDDAPTRDGVSFATMDGDGRIIWPNQGPERMEDRQVAIALAPFAVAPEATLGRQSEFQLRRYADARLEDEGDSEPFPLSCVRWAPKVAVARQRRIAQAQISKGSLRHAEETALLFTEEDRGALRTLAQSPLCDGDDKARLRELGARQGAAVLAAIEKGVSEQIEALEAVGGAPVFSKTIAWLMPPLGAEDVARVCRRLPDMDQEELTGWLALLSDAAVSVPLPPEADVFVGLTKHSDSDVRALAMSIIWDGDERLRRALVASGWTHQFGDRREAIAGSALVAAYSEGMTFDEARSRIMPEAFAYLVEKRGLEVSEVEWLREYVTELLADEVSGRVTSRKGYGNRFKDAGAWTAVIARDTEGAIIGYVRRLIEKGHFSGFFDALPVIPLMESLFMSHPEATLDLWRAASVRNREHNIGVGNLDLLPFRAGDNEFKAKGRTIGLAECRSDLTIAERVIACEHGGHRAWLLAKIDELAQSTALDEIALALTCAGFLHSGEESEALWRRLDALPLRGWLSNVRAVSLMRWRDHVHAAHWVDAFLDATDRRDAYVANALYEGCCDERGVDLLDERVNAAFDAVPKAWIRHLNASRQSRSNAVRKRAEDRRAVLFCTKRADGVAPWF
ncbi:MAG: hypothetical protein ABUL42_02935 [Terricaulis silvestris]